MTTHESSHREHRRGLVAVSPNTHRVRSCVALLVCALFACGLSSLIATPSTAASGYAYDGLGHLYDGTSHSAHEHIHQAGPVVSRAVAETFHGTVATAMGTFSVVFAKSVAANSVRYGPMNAGPLPESVAGTFRSGSYTGFVTTEETILYRAYGGSARPYGEYWTRTQPTGPLQAQMDNALNPAWGNTATEVATIRVPAGTTLYEGVAAPQGGLLGGGNQIYIPGGPNPAWAVP